MTASELVLGIDIGTASSKGVLALADGTIVAAASVPHAMSLPRPGWAEVDADAVWWADVVALCRELVSRANGGSIKGVCMSGVGPCLLLCDSQNRPLRPAILYGIDMRATDEFDELTSRYGAHRIVERCGTSLTTQAVGPKMLWARRHEPEVWARSARWYNSSSYAVTRLTDEYVLDHHTASSAPPCMTSPRSIGIANGRPISPPTCRCRVWRGRARSSGGSRDPQPSRLAWPSTPP